MSNHSSDSDPAPDPILRKMLEKIGEPLGKTGQHPRGRLTPTDEGGIRMAVGSRDGVVVLDFGTPVAWVGLPPSEARQLAASLMKHADAIDGGDPAIFETAARARDVR